MNILKSKKKTLISIIGLGYVGLPLAIEFSKKFNLVAYDINQKRIKQLKNNYDKNNEISSKEISNVKKKIFFTSNENYLKNSKYFIITVPTPIKKNKQPDLSFLKRATKLVGRNLSKKSIVIYESTTYPGCTEEVCIPILESISPG